MTAINKSALSMYRSPKTPHLRAEYFLVKSAENAISLSGLPDKSRSTYE